jgi:hypothetical protein
MDDSDIVKSVARGMIERFGDGAVGFVREQAEIADALPDMPSAKAWRDIADAIKRLRPEPE